MVDVEAALRDVFGESMRLDLDFSEENDASRPAGPDAQFGARNLRRNAFPITQRAHLDVGGIFLSPGRDSLRLRPAAACFQRHAGHPPSIWACSYHGRCARCTGAGHKLIDLRLIESVPHRKRAFRAAAEAHLLDVVRKQLELSRALPEDTRRRRLISFLQRRGHTWDTISKLMQQTELSQQ